MLIIVIFSFLIHEESWLPVGISSTLLYVKLFSTTHFNTHFPWISIHFSYWCYTSKNTTRPTDLSSNSNNN